MSNIWEMISGSLYSYVINLHTFWHFNLASKHWVWGKRQEDWGVVVLVGNTPVPLKNHKPQLHSSSGRQGSFSWLLLKVWPSLLCETHLGFLCTRRNPAPFPQLTNQHVKTSSPENCFFNHPLPSPNHSYRLEIFERRIQITAN